MIRNVDKLVDALSAAGLPDADIAGLRPRLTTWRTQLDARRQCLWPKCRRPPIGSHVISQTFLEVIADGGKGLKTPKNPETFTAYPRASRIGSEAPSKASTFPGFCGTHDHKEFAGFENARRLRHLDDYRRQLIRTTTIEWQNRSDLIDLLNFLRKRDSGVSSFFATPGFDARLARTQEHYRQLEQLRLSLHADLSLPSTESGSVAIHTASHESVNGVALSYADFFEAQDIDDGGSVPFPLAIAVVPQRSDPEAATDEPTTRLILGSTDRQALDLYVARHLSSPLRAHDSVMAWLGKGCFSWWINPGKWEAMSSQEQDEIKRGLTRF
ncbi:hypothetical protein GCM10023350_53500 [Nocardioides endophyticus]|uniref:Uncharacterized protein n=1 Tax=Nocardioides endophyticus TaxID=1353775 RepID=A0ABP8ZMJ3_9ACTN